MSSADLVHWFRMGSANLM